MYDSLHPLGMIGAAESDHSAATTFLAGLVREARQDRDAWDAIYDSNLTIYTYGKDPKPADDELVIHDIQNAIIAATDIQTKEPPTATLEPVETGETPQYFWAGPDWLGISLGLTPDQVSPWADPNDPGLFVDPPAPTLHPPQPLDPNVGDELVSFASMGQPLPFPSPLTGLPVMLKEDWIVAVNDELVAETYQSVFDVLWARVQMDRRIRSNLLWTNIFGWTFWLYEWDDDRRVPVVRPMPARQVAIDPTVEDIGDAQYVIIDLWLDADEAKALYPALAQQIDENARTGQPLDPQEAEGNWGQAFDREFERPGVTMRVAWLRNQPVPLDAETAVGMGLVEAVEVPDEAAGAAEMEAADELAGMMEESSDEQQMGTGGGVADVEHGGLGGDGNPEAAAEPISEPNGAGGLVPSLPTRLAYLIDGEEVTPVINEDGHTRIHPRWPVRRVIRQVTSILNAVIDDRECEHHDIPILHNVNIPVPGKPYGMGEPFRLEKIQNANSEVVASMVGNAEQFKAPVQIQPASVYEYLKKEYGQAYITPGKVLIVDDALLMQAGGKIDFTVDPPAMPPGLVQLHPILKGLITEQSGYSDVLQGRASSNLSGRAIETLQTSAASMIGFKSQRTGDLVYRLARLMLHSIVTRMSAEEIGRIVSKYPGHILAAIHERARRMDWDVKVTVSSGNGAIRAQKQQSVRENFAAGLVDEETAQEDLGIDAKQVRRRKEAMARRQLAMVGAQQPGAANNQQTQGDT